MTTVADAPSMPSSKPKFGVQWTDDSSAWVTAEADGRSFNIATIGWNGGEWFFWRVDPAGDIVTDGGHFISVENDLRMKLIREQQEIAMGGEGPAADALKAELAGRLITFRESTKDYVEWAAKVKAKTWWPCYWLMVDGCTATFGAAGDLWHVNVDCPVHEA